MRTKWLLTLATLMGGFPAAVPAQLAPAATAVEWKVVDRFRLFDQAEAAARRRVEELLDALQKGSPSNGGLFQFHDVILRTVGGEGAKGLRRSNFTPREGAAGTSGRYHSNYLYPAHYRVSVAARGPSPTSICAWRIGNTSKTAACGARAELIVPANDAGTGATAELFLAVDGRPEVLATELQIEDELIVAMGDSYISGEGNPDVAAGFNLPATGDPRFRRADWPSRLDPDRDKFKPAQWWDRGCHRSLLSWPVLASLRHAAQNPHKALTLVHLGCSGDEVDDGVLSRRRELPGGGAELQSQLSLLEELRDRPAGAKRPVSRLLLSIGGNDIGFGYLVAGMLLPPNGWRLMGPAARLAGDAGMTACAYRVVAHPLSRFCGGKEVRNEIPIDRRSAEERLGELDEKLNRLADTFRSFGIKAPVYQVAYPNPFIGADGEVCRTVLNEKDFADLRRRIGWSWLLGGRKELEERYRRELAYAQGKEGRARAGYEALLGQVEESRRGKRLWSFQVLYAPEKQLHLDQRLDPAAICDDEPEPRDSEVCQGMWVWANLNRKIEEGAPRRGWHMVTAHQPVIRTNGWCNDEDGPPLRFPVQVRAADGSYTWEGGAPADYKAYDPDSKRWFRTANDSALTEFVSSDDFHRGTFHPTYRAHIAIADAVAAEAFSEGPR